VRGFLPFLADAKAMQGPSSLGFLLLKNILKKMRFV